MNAAESIFLPSPPPPPASHSPFVLAGDWRNMHKQGILNESETHSVADQLSIYRYREMATQARMTRDLGLVKVGGVATLSGRNWGLH